MPHAFSGGQFVFRLFLILVDMLVNYLTLLTQHDYVSFIVFFNAGMILFILILDLTIVAVRRIRTNYVVGEGLTDLYKHEH
jgi:hypothetical protein